MTECTKTTGPNTGAYTRSSVLSLLRLYWAFCPYTSYRQSCTAMEHLLGVILKHTTDILGPLPGGEGPQARIFRVSWATAKGLARSSGLL
jgi:hypothetical protein